MGAEWKKSFGGGASSWNYKKQNKNRKNDFKLKYCCTDKERIIEVKGQLIESDKTLPVYAFLRD